MFFDHCSEDYEFIPSLDVPTNAVDALSDVLMLNSRSLRVDEIFKRVDPLCSLFVGKSRFIFVRRVC